jgi:hypothetical protein
MDIFSLLYDLVTTKMGRSRRLLIRLLLLPITLVVGIPLAQAQAQAHIASFMKYWRTEVARLGAPAARPAARATHHSKTGHHPARHVSR